MLNFVLTLEAGGQKNCQNILRSTWNTEYEKSNNTDDNKSKYSSNPMIILKSEKKKKKYLHQVHFYIDFPITSTFTNEPLWVMLTFPTHRHLSNSRKKLLSQKMFSSC